MRIREEKAIGATHDLPPGKARAVACLRPSQVLQGPCDAATYMWNVSSRRMLLHGPE